MEFIGDQATGMAAPRLRDAHCDWLDAYEQTLVLTRRLWQRSKLIHADLSEYNLLWQDNKVVMIDVGQAVEYDHPMALDFLRRDLTVILDFFSKKKVKVMMLQETYDYITAKDL